MFRGLGLCVVLTAGTTHGGDPVFVEVAPALSVDVVHFTSGYSHSNSTSGGAVANFNNDGLMDIYVTSIYFPSIS